MADQEEKFPPRPPHRPCGPWPSVFPYDKDYPGDHPPHRPPHWHHWNDTEPVMGAYPWEHCCDGDEDPCLRITSGEVNIWNQTYSAVSGHSAAWDRAVDDSWKNSADNWQSTYETVSANSAFWDSAYRIASALDSGANESIYNIISATSAFLKTYRAEPYFHANSAYFQGNGSPEHPLDLSDIYKMYWGWIDNAMNDLYSGGKWGDSGSRRWMSDSGYSDLKKWVEYIDQLMWKPGPETDSPDGEPRSNYGGIFYQLEKLWHSLGDSAYLVVTDNSGHWNSTYQNVLANSGRWESDYETTNANSGNWNGAYESVETNSGSWNDTCATVTENSASWAKGSHETWEYAPEMTIENYAKYKDLDKIYFNFRD